MSCEIRNNAEIHFAPLQGYTDKEYRYAFEKNFGEIDFYYSPYVSVRNDSSIDALEDITFHENEKEQLNLIPQILPGNMDELKLLMNAIVPLGYKKININAGCPYSMVTRKGRGAALILQPEKVTEMINLIHGETDFELSLKTRAGFENGNDIFHFLGQIPLDKLSEVIVHPRVAKQLYKGEADVAIFKKCIQNFPETSFIYNGDIKTLSDFQQKKEVVPMQKKWMIGRGLLENPFLAIQIKSENSEYFDVDETKLCHFIFDLIHQIEEKSMDKGHALNRCKIQMNILLNGFPTWKKSKKKIEKLRSMEELKAVVVEQKSKLI